MIKITSTLKKAIEKMTTGISFEITEEREKCLDILKNTNENLFITGKAGTGKSLLIQYFRETTQKKIVVLAPTGIAALNARGQTIHSFFGFPPRLIEPRSIHRVLNNQIFANLDTIIIDEISMVRADLLDGIDRFLRLNGMDEKLPFGGIQVVFVGDLYQLPPVVTEMEAEIFNQFYNSPYFFSANCFRLEDFNIVELNTMFRQKETEFINFLNDVRIGETDIEKFKLINDRVTENEPDDDYVILCTINKVADTINQKKLDEIDEPLYTYEAEIIDRFPIENKNFTAVLSLQLKVGARVLFLKNDLAKRWVNGTLGWVSSLDEKTVKIKMDSGIIVSVGIEEWDNIEYVPDEKNGGLKEKIIGRLKQYPLRLAWAITIHKSQGMSLDKVCLDFRRSPFAHGQTYVALSRCRKLEGLILTRHLWPNDILIDDRIVEFQRRIDYLKKR